MIKLFSLDFCFNSEARFKLAQVILDIAERQANQKLQAICLLVLGEISQNIQLLLRAEKIYERS